MVIIKTLQFPGTISVTQYDKYIGIQNETNSRLRYFCLPKKYNNIDLSSGSASVVLQVQPVNKGEKSYLDLLMPVSEEELESLGEEDRDSLKHVNIANCVFYRWDIKSHNTKNSGILIVNLKILDTENNIIGQTYVSEFIVSPTVADFENDIADLSIWEQAVAEATKQANIAKEAVDQLADFLVDGEISVDTTLTEDVTATGVSVGNINDGDILEEGLSFTDFAKKLLIRMIPPIYLKPTLSISTASTKTVEVGTSINAYVTPLFTQNDGGIIQEYVLDKNGTAIFTSSTAQSYNIPEFIIGDETVRFVAKCTYEEGATKNNNLGEPYPDGKITAGTIQSGEIVFIGHRNAFYGSDNIGEPIASSLDVRKLGSSVLGVTEGSEFIINVPAGHKRICICYPSILRDVTSIRYVEVNDEYKGLFSLKTIPVSGVSDYYEIPYKCYEWIIPVVLEASMTLQVKI